MKDHPTISRMPGGFTLVELMTVIAILSVLAAVAYPLINASLPKYRLRAAARELVIDFKRAKVEAIKRNRNVLIQFTPVAAPAVGGSYTLCADDNGNNACDAGETIISQVAMPKGVRLREPDGGSAEGNKFPNNTAGYNGRGLPWNNQLGSIIMTTADTSRWYRISLSMSGAVNM
ncbi:GspH/FimT family pseudopilin [Desulfobulbus elongatus]|uniref:GspH/FimT family pseudopilin n=1 Tax=Desulfobulbus elongatus TaxID=53332 RepID=UPI0006875ADA|nr:GspH/FimT family pseudopilin [Desulfobulbus elongatus]